MRQVLRPRRQDGARRVVTVEVTPALRRESCQSLHLEFQHRARPAGSLRRKRATEVGLPVLGAGVRERR